MTKEQHQRAKAVFDEAIGKPPDQRAAFAESACTDDPVVRDYVLNLLEHYVDDGETSTATETRRELQRTSTDGERWIGPYKLGRKIGAGGMGIVYKATQDTPIQRTVAVKLIKPELVNVEQVLTRFESERQALALMNHPNIARVLDAGADPQEGPYFVMEYVHGIPIHDYCDRHNVPVNDRLDLLIQVCNGVQHAHQKGIIHRDLKPTNILVEIQDDKPVPRIIDFGVAKAVNKEITGRTLMTEHGLMIGTPEYMSPEQIEMTDLDIDTRTDVYALGVILYQLLVGDLPFSSKELREAGWDEMRRKIREETPHKPSTKVTTLGELWGKIAQQRSADPTTLIHEYRGDLDWITMKALEKDRTRRYASASEFAADLRHHLLHEPVSAGPPSASYRLQKFVRRHRVGVGMTAALIALFIAGFAGTAYGLVRALAAEKKAVLEAETVSRVSDFMFDMFEINDPSEARGNTVTAREILDRGARDIRVGLENEPKLQSRLMESMGIVYRKLGLYRDSASLLEDAVASAQRGYGDGRPEVARVMTTQAGALIKARRISEAVTLLERALSIQRSALDDNDPELSRTLNNLAGTLRAMQRYGEALPYYEEALTIRQHALGPDHLDVAKIWNNIGSVKARLKDFDGASEALQRALRIRELRLKPDDPVLAKTLNNLGELCLDQNDLGRARAYVTRAIKLQEQSLGVNHPDLVNTLLNLGQIERAANDATAAVKHLERALAIGRKTLQPTDRRLGLVRGELVLAYEALGEPEKAAQVIGTRPVVRE